VLIIRTEEVVEPTASTTVVTTTTTYPWDKSDLLSLARSTTVLMEMAMHKTIWEVILTPISSSVEPFPSNTVYTQTINPESGKVE
jgi:hypothetical protein